MEHNFDQLMDEILKNPKDSRNYLKVGRYLLIKGHFSESLGFLKKAEKLGDKSFDLDFYFGKVYLFLSCSEKSLCHFKKALKKKPDHKEAQYIIETLVEEKHDLTESLDASIVKALFDDYAIHFEGHLLNKLHYETPKKLVKYLLSKTKEEMILSEKTPLSVLDLGCGTGLFAQELKKILKSCILTGVDLSWRMLKEAEKKDIYFRLCENDLFNYIEEEKRKKSIYDLVVACDTVPYIGNLEDLFNKTSQVLAPGGFFLFSFEALDESEKGWLFSCNGRFKHCLKYVKTLAYQNNFRGEIKLETLREERGERVKGCFFLGRSIKINEY